MRPLRVDLDTSVIGGCCDSEFAKDSLALLDRARKGHIVLFVSSVLYQELGEAPVNVQTVLTGLPASALERISATDEAGWLRDCYLAAGILAPKFYQDALHVATATVNDADLIASWNFRHMFQVEKIRASLAVNIANGYRAIDIRTPTEIVPAEDADDE